MRELIVYKRHLKTGVFFTQESKIQRSPKKDTMEVPMMLLATFISP